MKTIKAFLRGLFNGDPAYTSTDEFEAYIIGLIWRGRFVR
jgi:hypothetical protein